jgi:hypothetical protein
MVPKGAFIEPQLVIFIEHEGDGIVSFYNSSNRDQNTCDDIGSTQVNKMELVATLGNDTLQCFPNPIFFRDGAARIECRLKGSQVLATAANYFTNLNVELKYLYTQTFERTIGVQRTDSAAFTGVESFDYGECPPWDMWVEADQTCISKCSYCAQTGNQNSVECATTDKSSFSSGNKKIGEYYGCVYTYTECIEAGEHCIQQNSEFCLPGMYCGEPECAYNPKKNSKPTVNLEPGTPEGRIMWYCQDKDNTVDLADSCGCLDTSYYAILPQGVLDCDSTNLDYRAVVSSKSNPSTIKTYYSIDMDLASKPEGICLKVKDAQGLEVTKKAFFDCVDQDICFKS